MVHSAGQRTLNGKTKHVFQSGLVKVLVIAAVGLNELRVRTCLVLTQAQVGLQDVERRSELPLAFHQGFLRL